jgi:hypothetical protein
MECIICDRKFNSLSSFYRHNWSDKHLLMCQIKDYEKEIKQLERKIALADFVKNESSQNHNIDKIQDTPHLDPFK